MQSNKLRMAIRATAAMAVFGTVGMVGQVQAFEIQAGGAKAEIYGYARLTATYDINEKITGDNSTLAGDFGKVSASDNEGHFDASATQSRLGVRTTLPSGVNITVEGDFADNFRLRHAFGEYNGVLMGQTWSNYNSFTGNTPTLDFNGSAGWAGYQVRTAQVRYTTGGLSFSAEDPKGKVVSSGDPATDIAKDAMPAFTVRYEGSSDALSFSAAGLVKQAGYETAANDDSAVGFAAFGAAAFKLSDMFSIQGSLNYTDGANGYLYLSGGPDAIVDGAGDLDTLSGMGGSIGTSLNLGGGRSVNLVYGTTILDYDAGDATNSNVLLNYMWTPIKDTMMGVEYGYWQTEDPAGNSENANRIMFAAQYNF